MSNGMNISSMFKSARVNEITIPIKDYQRPDVFTGKGWAKEKKQRRWKRRYKSGFRTFPYFVGREQVAEQLKDRLKAAPDKGAAYLLVGARGAGKTTLVNKVIQDLQLNEKDVYRPIDISLSNENFEEIDIYRIIGKRFGEIFLKYNRGVLVKPWFLDKLLLFLGGSSLFYLLSMLLRFFWHKWILVKYESIPWPFSSPVGYQNIISLVALIIPLLLVLIFFWRANTLSSVYAIRRRVKTLLKRIEADIVKSESVGLNGGKFPVNLGWQQSKKYSIADIRFIEHELITLLRLVNQTYSKQRFVFIFDELDKIEFHQNVISDERSYEQSEEDNITRRQQKAVIDILGNFKYFLNHACAKFIFIAGSEMTDAAMADISKRDFYLRSIFDEIITLDSLLKEDLKKIKLRITSGVEAYVYGIILGEKNFKEGSQHNLLTFKKTACLLNADEEKVLEFDEGLHPQAHSVVHEKIERNNGEIELSELAVEVIQKIILADGYGGNEFCGLEVSQDRYTSFLKDFILYITFRSHGSPRLMFQYFEKYIIPCDKKGSFKLYFTHKQQMIIGFVANLYRGLIREHYNITVGNSDKLLSNLPFIFSHVLKFHDFAFSWRSLELLPEVIDVNKSPNLRKHVRTVVQYLTNGHVKDISNGLFEYKFTVTAANEIRYASEISKTSRAAFNFTLDESFPLKKYYQQRIDRLKKNLREDDPNADYIHSLGFFYMIMGDLHFYDKEYDKAIENYDSVVQPFRQKTLSPVVSESRARVRSHELIIYIRGMLKIILTLERMKLYDSVFTYLETNNKHVVTYYGLANRLKEIKNYSDPEDIIRSSNFQLNNQLIFVDGFLNVLFVAEKTSRQGVTQRDIDLSTNRFTKITGVSTRASLGETIPWYFSMLRGHFYNQLGHLLFYKNGFLPGYQLRVQREGERFRQDRSKKMDYAEYFFYSMVKEFQINDGDESKPLPDHMNIPISAYHEYYRSLQGLLEDAVLNFGEPEGAEVTFKDNENYLLKRYTQFLYSSDLLFPHNYQSRLFNQIGKYIGHFGDTILCLCQEGQASNSDIMTLIKTIMDPNLIGNDKSGIMHVFDNEALLDSKGNRFVLYSYLSGLYYKNINRQKQYAHSLTKILYLIKYNALRGQALSWADANTLYNKIIYRALKALFISCRYKDVEGFLEAKDLDAFKGKMEAYDGEENRGIHSIIAYPGVKEVIIVFFEILIASSDVDPKDSELETMVDTIIKYNWIDQSTTLNHSFARTMELRYKAVVNKVLLDSIRDTDPNAKEQRVAIYADSLWCLRKVLTNLHVYGISYITNYYFRAEASHSMVDLLEELNGETKEVQEKLVSHYNISMDKDRLEEFFNPAYHKREALNNYRNCIQMHSQGECYYGTIRQMYYLEGDFDDQTSHFCATLDRYRINTGVIGTKIKECKT